MVDVSLVRSNGKSYSIKSVLTETDDGVKLRISYVYEVDNVDGNSYTKVKTVFDNADGGIFNRKKFSAIFDELVKSISSKYGVKTIII